MNHKKLSRTPLLDQDVCLENAGGNRFEMVVMAAVRAREIVKANKSWGKTRHVNAAMEALFDLQDGKVTKDYLKRVK